jgi:uncharacterized protein YggU (UPF0235/DUF167 family)
MTKVLKVIVHPNARIERVLEGEVLRVYVTETATKNKANVAVEKALSKFFRRRVRIVASFRDRVKIVEVAD